ncbi:Ig-like domain-containing protein [Vallitalea pronyensis]|uniref:Ig-like domain-containing protein n=1 Tax=Vallitalea pronyensis TaxID=1348613 RepID=A0A8J8MM69_9FIRM|nr:Ig-like domain-containing protein [Vallitalea pronyensis]QUI24422.1 Ig-like domain-containing protein [Vallitalea pronyensis]
MSTKIKVHNYSMVMKQGSRMDGRILIKNISRDQIQCSFDKEPEHGKAELTTNGYWSYVPTKDFVGQEQFRIKVMITDVGEKYSTITIDVEEQELSTKISKFLQFEERLMIENYEDEIVEISHIAIITTIKKQEQINNHFNHTSKLKLEGSIKYVIYCEVGLVPAEKRSFWMDESIHEGDFIAEKQVQVEKEIPFETEMELGDYVVDDDVEILSEIKYQSFRLINYDEVHHYCAVELYIDK